MRASVRVRMRARARARVRVSARERARVRASVRARVRARVRVKIALIRLCSHPTQSLHSRYLAETVLLNYQTYPAGKSGCG